jgi:hypothetical protein
MAPFARNSDSLRGRYIRTITRARAAGIPASRAAGGIGSLVPGTICRTREIVSKPPQPARTRNIKTLCTIESAFHPLALPDVVKAAANTARKIVTNART